MQNQDLPAKPTCREDSLTFPLEILDLKPKGLSSFPILFHEPPRPHRGGLEVPEIFNSNSF